MGMNILEMREPDRQGATYRPFTAELGWVGTLGGPGTVSRLVSQLPLHAVPHCYGNQTADIASGSTRCPSKE